MTLFTGNVNSVEPVKSTELKHELLTSVKLNWIYRFNKEFGYNYSSGIVHEISAIKEKNRKLVQTDNHTGFVNNWNMLLSFLITNFLVHKLCVWEYKIGKTNLFAMGHSKSKRKANTENC